MADLARVLINGTQIIDGSRNLENVVSLNGISATEISYLNGITSSVQTQINTINLGIPTELDDFTDVTITTPSNGEVLYYVTDKFINASLADAGISSTSHDHSGVYLESMGALNDLSDVDAGSPSDNQVLSYDTASGKWIAETIGAGVTAINDLSDVTITTATTNHLLYYNGSAWVNGTYSYTNLTDKPSIPTQYTDEMAQDAIGAMIADGTTINFTYTDATPELTAEVIVGAIDHDSLLNFSSDEHFTQAAISITASQVSDFDTEVSNNTDVSANTSARHSAVTIGTANGLSLNVQALSLGLASSGVTGALSGTDWNTFNGKQDTLTFGIANTNAVQINSADVADDEYARFTASGLESRSISEMKTDLSLNNVENTAISSWTGSSNITTVGTIGTGTWQGGVIAEAYLPNASSTAQGVVELAIASEVSTGTDTSRAITPDALAGSDMGYRSMSVQIFDGATAVATGDGKAYFAVPSWLAGWNLIDAESAVITKSTSGTPTVQCARGRQASATSDFTYNDMFSTALTIDENEYHSKDDSSAVAINTSYDDIAEGDIIRFDVDTAGTGTKGLLVTLTFQLP